MLSSLSKLLYPNLPRDQRRRKMQVIYLTSLISLFFLMLLVSLMLLMTRH